MRRGPPTATLTSLSFKPQEAASHRHHFVLRLSKSLYSRYDLFKRNNNFGSVFTNRLDRRIYKTRFPTRQFFFLQIFYFSKHFNFFFDNQNILLVNVATASLYQSLVNCRSSKIQGNFTQKVNSTDYCHYQAWNLHS